MSLFVDINVKLSEEKATEDSGIKQFLFQVKTNAGKKKFDKFIADQLNDDCWGFVINNETVFNSYNEEGWNQIIDNKIKRDYLINNIDKVLSRIYTDKLYGSTLRIYMANGPAKEQMSRIQL